MAGVARTDHQNICKLSVISSEISRASRMGMTITGNTAGWRTPSGQLGAKLWRALAEVTSQINTRRPRAEWHFAGVFATLIIYIAGR